MKALRICFWLFVLAIVASAVIERSRPPPQSQLSSEPARWTEEQRRAALAELDRKVDESCVEGLRKLAYATGELWWTSPTPWWIRDRCTKH